MTEARRIAIDNGMVRIEEVEARGLPLAAQWQRQSRADRRSTTCAPATARSSKSERNDPPLRRRLRIECKGLRATFPLTRSGNDVNREHPSCLQPATIPGIYSPRSMGPSPEPALEAYDEFSRRMTGLALLSAVMTMPRPALSMTSNQPPPSRRAGAALRAWRAPGRLRFGIVHVEEIRALRQSLGDRRARP